MITVIESFKKYSVDEIIDFMDRFKAIIYTRVSTHDQAERGYSLQSQVEKCAELARNKFSYKDEELLAIVEKGEMGDDPDRPGLNHALYLLEEGVGKQLIMLHPDRMSRYLALQNEVATKVWGCGADLEFVEFDVDPSNPESMLMFNIQGSIAQYNKAKILANSKRGRMQKVKEGKIPGLRRVFGYTFDKKEDILVENPKEKKTYLLMIDWLLNGKDGEDMNCSKIARELARLGYPAPSSNKWYQSTISRILRNEIYKGHYFYGKTEVVQIKGKKMQIDKPREEWKAIPIPRYIDDLTFEKVQKKLDSLVTRNRGRRTNNYLLKSLVRCGRCGKAVVVGSSSKLKSGKVLRYYACSGRTKKNYKIGTGEPNEVCHGPNWRQDIIDKYVWDEIVKIIKNPKNIIKEIIKQQSDLGRINELKSNINKFTKEIKKKRTGQKKCVTAYREGLIPEDLFKEEMSTINKEVEELENELLYNENLLAQINSTSDELELLKETIETYQGLITTKSNISFKLKREIVNTCIKNVILHNDAIEIVTSWKKSDAENPRSYSNNCQGDGGSQR